MHIKLSRMARIITGYAFRKSINPDEHGDVFVLQAKDIRFDIITDVYHFISVEDQSFKKDVYLQYNDIVLVSKVLDSKVFRSTIFKSTSKNVIASSSIHIIRITDDTIVPEYVLIFLNSPQGQKVISEKISGSYIKTISRSSLGDREIPVPNINEQKKIIELHTNIKEQEILHTKKIYLLQNIKQSLFNTYDN